MSDNLLIAQPRCGMWGDKRVYILDVDTGWGPQSIAFSCLISGFMVDITVVTGIYMGL